MKELSDMGDKELLNELAGHVNDQFTLLRFRAQVISRIMRNCPLTAADVKVLDDFIALVRKMQDEDLDLISRSSRVRRSEKECSELREQLLARMSRQEQLCQCGTL